jgi:hypothetical protein
MSELFKQWLHAFDAKTGSQNRKIVLFADHCPAYPAIKLRNNELGFLPPKTVCYNHYIKASFNLWNITFNTCLWIICWK